MTQNHEVMWMDPEREEQCDPDLQLHIDQQKSYFDAETDLE